MSDERKNNNVRMGSEKVQLSDLETKLLEELADSRGNILEGDGAFYTLTHVMTKHGFESLILSRKTTLTP